MNVGALPTPAGFKRCGALFVPETMLCLPPIGCGGAIGRSQNYGSAIPPSISSLNYTQGDPLGGGQSIVITGTNLLGSTNVHIGGNDVAPSGSTSTTCTFSLPAHVAAVVSDVQVTTPGGASGTTSFEYWSPASLSLSGWWKANFASAPWAGNASAGASSGRNLTTNGADPTTGTTQGGFTPPAFASQNLVSAVNNNTYFGGNGSLYSLFFATAAPAPVGTAYGDGNIFSNSSNAETEFGFTSSGIGACVLDSSVTYQRINVGCGTGAWHLAQFKFDGTNLKARVDNGSWSSIACTAYTPVTPGGVKVGTSFGASNFAGRILELAPSTTVVSDANFDKIRLYCNQRYGVSV